MPENLVAQERDTKIEPSHADLSGMPWDGLQIAGCFLPGRALSDDL
ncbi:MAG: hypothetical protein QM636_00390 [Rhizobium sp.]